MTSDLEMDQRPRPMTACQGGFWSEHQVRSAEVLSRLEFGGHCDWLTAYRAIRVRTIFVAGKRDEDARPVATT